MADAHSNHEPGDRRTALHNRRGDRTRQHAGCDVLAHCRQPRRHLWLLGQDLECAGHQIHAQEQNAEPQQDLPVRSPIAVRGELEQHEPQRDKEQTQVAEPERHDLGRDRRPDFLAHHHAYGLFERHQVGVNQANHGHHQQAAALDQGRCHSAKGCPFERLVGHPVQPFLDPVSCQLFHARTEHTYTKEKEGHATQDLECIEHGAVSCLTVRRCDLLEVWRVCSLSSCATYPVSRLERSPG